MLHLRWLIDYTGTHWAKIMKILTMAHQSKDYWWWLHCVTLIPWLSNDFIVMMTKLREEVQTSQELRNCPLGQRKALLKEKLYWKKGFFDIKALLKERFYCRKGPYSIWWGICPNCLYCTSCLHCLHCTGWFFSLVTPNFSTKKKTHQAANHGLS